MKEKFIIIFNENPSRVEVNKNVLDLAIRVTNYINDNFDASDYFTIGNESHEKVFKFLIFLKENHGLLQTEVDLLPINIDTVHFSMLENIFIYASNF